MSRALHDLDRSPRWNAHFDASTRSFIFQELERVANRHSLIFFVYITRLISGERGETSVWGDAPSCHSAHAIKPAKVG